MHWMPKSIPPTTTDQRNLQINQFNEDRSIPEQESFETIGLKTDPIEP